MNEFEIIKKFFSSPPSDNAHIVVGIGDDAAVVAVPHGNQLVITTDTLVSGNHFPENTSSYDIGYKSLAVNLSDLAAMGATPAWVTLALTIPSADETWLSEFARGFFDLANQYQVKLIGGDTTRGPLSITVQALGFVSIPHVLLRKNAEVDDLIFVSNTLGDAGIGLKISEGKLKLEKHTETFLQKLNRPHPQIALGKELSSIANAAIDISDGLVADLQHILEASAVGAEIYLENLPLSSAMTASIKQADAIKFALTSGDDYELCFTITEEKANQHAALLKLHNCTCIGKITATKNLKLFLDGQIYQENLHGYQHFT